MTMLNAVHGRPLLPARGDARPARANRVVMAAQDSELASAVGVPDPGVRWRDAVASRRTSGNHTTPEPNRRGRAAPPARFR
jgi:hypothetical protein